MGDKSGPIRYTVNYTYADLPDRPLLPPSNRSQDDEASRGTMNEKPPVLEIVTNVDDKSPNIDRDVAVVNTRQTTMIVHSRLLAQIIDDVVDFYPSSRGTIQIISGENLTIREPYAILMHHLPELQDTMQILEDKGDLQETVNDVVRRDHLKVLLDFLIPKFEKLCGPALSRLSQPIATTTFDDIWYLMRPGSLAYVDWHNECIGCVIEKIEKLAANPSLDVPEAWKISICFLRTGWTNNRVSKAPGTTTIERFDGEREVCTLPLFPRDFHDRHDSGARRFQFEERGLNVFDLLKRQSKHVSYAGELFDVNRTPYRGEIILGSDPDIEVAYPSNEWNLREVSPKWIAHKNLRIVPESSKEYFDTDITKLGAFSSDQLFIMSPCLLAFALSTKTWVPVNVSNIRELDIPSPAAISESTIDKDKLALINALVRSRVPRDDLPLSSYYGQKRNGAVIILQGPSGVGKSHLVETISTQFRRPLMTLMPRDLDILNSRNPSDWVFTKWFSLAEKWNAILYIDGCDSIQPGVRFGREDLQAGFLRALDHFGGAIFLSLDSEKALHDTLASRANLIVPFQELGPTQRCQIWKSLARKMEQDHEHLHLSSSARFFLESRELHGIQFNGHEISRSFQSVLALAEYQAKAKANSEDAKECSIVVDIDHFKDVLNMAFASRLDTRTKDKARNPGVYIRPTPPYRDVPSQPGLEDNTRGEAERVWEKIASIEARDLELTRSPKLDLGPAPPLTLENETDLCIPELNWVEWTKFQAKGRGELFRKTKFHAIDVLLGEPVVRLEAQAQRRKKDNLSGRSNTKPDGSHQSDEQKQKMTEDRQMLPERIRINSAAIREAFGSIHGEEDFDHTKPFLIFRPFKSLLYYEEDFKEWISKRQKDLPHTNTHSDEDGTHDDKQGDDVATEAIDQKVLRRSREQSEREEIQCLLSFIDTIIKRREQAFCDFSCQKVTFGDVWLLFKPGDTVIANSDSQAYRVIKTTGIRHLYKDPRKRRSKFWKDETKAELRKDPVLVHCVSIDFDGEILGPVLTRFQIQRFDGEQDVQSLPIYPLGFADEKGLRTKLIDRGKLFLKVAGMRHMHYSGLTLEARDEVDSQVVIDFEEALEQQPRWAPQIQSAIEFKRHGTTQYISDSESDIGEDIVIRERYGRRERYRDRDSLSRSPSPLRENTRMKHERQYVRPRVDIRRKPCLDECCGNEICHHDEYVNERRSEDYITAHMRDSRTGLPPVAILPRPLSETTGDNSLSEDDLIIMSNRVFGFILRNRKWAKLSLSNISEVAVISEGEGFDQLVLPPGHKEMVKSMIRQHFREKKILPGDRGQGDVVRGKGKGLIMLLHGVPGVGKTSTAECVADFFRKPLFQITSGDLGTTAKDVEEALEENFSLASRWDCILLIDEADVFLAERTKEDFVRNSLVAVFLRILEYYAGVLFLTTNRVGVFDEAFTSRIHISLYYPPLERDASHRIFEKNMDRIKARYEKNQRRIDIKVSEISKFALDYYDANQQGRWNGRQISNAFQSALALAELDALGPDDSLDEIVTDKIVTLGRSNFEVVAAAYKGFIDYLNQTYGADYARRARENLWRSDTFGMPKLPNPLTTRMRPAGVGPQMSEAWARQNHASFSQNNAAPQQFAPQGAYGSYYSEQPRDPRYGSQVYPNPPGGTAPLPPTVAYGAFAGGPSSLQPDNKSIPTYPQMHNVQQGGAQPGFSGSTLQEPPSQMAPSTAGRQVYGAAPEFDPSPHWQHPKPSS